MVNHLNSTLSQDTFASLVSEVHELHQLELGTAQHTIYTDEALNVTWTLYSTSLVMLMQLGFSLVESGSVRSSSFRHVFLKNMLDFILGMCFWWSIGYWVAFPDKLSGLFDANKYDILNSPAEGKSFAFQAMFATTACTIVSGAMAERTRMEAYLVFVVLMTSLAYSVVCQWTWGGGWMNDLDPPFHDFAGSGVIHETGGIAALVGAYLVGPRIGRFYQDPGVLRVPRPFAARSIDAIVMGTFLLWFGWFGFNPGSVGDIADVGSYPAATKAFVNTMMAPAFASLTVIFYDGSAHLIQYIRFGKLPHNQTHPKFDICMVSNSALSGLVSITAGCDACTSTWSALVGVVAAIVLLSSCHFLAKKHIDDPVGAVAVHGFNGIWGVLAVGFVHEDSGLLTTGQSGQLVSQCIGALVIGAYIGSTTFVYFYLVSCYGFLRVSKVVEVHGIDFEEFGEGEQVDTTQLNLEAQSEYSSSLYSSLSGDREGLEDAQCKQYALIHRRVNIATLTLAIVYNFFYYPYFQWQGWIFWAFVNTAVGLQSAAGAHAQFRVGTTDHKNVNLCICTVVGVGVALAITNYLITPTENLLQSYLETMSMAFFWAIWMQLRLQPLEWHIVSAFHKNIASTNEDEDGAEDEEGTIGQCLALVVYLKCLGELESQDNPMLRIFKMNTRLQHALEIAVVYASLIADLWVGLATVEEERLTGIILLFLVVVQLPGTLGKILEPTSTRSKKIVILLCINTLFTKGPILGIMVLSSSNEQSSIKLISIAFNAFSLAFQIVNVWVAVKYAQHRASLIRQRARARSNDSFGRENQQDADEDSSKSKGTSPSTSTATGTIASTSKGKSEKKRHQQEQSENTEEVLDRPRTKDVPIPAFVDQGPTPIGSRSVKSQKSSNEFSSKDSDTAYSFTLSDLESNVAASSEGKKSKKSKKESSSSPQSSPRSSLTPKVSNPTEGTNTCINDVSEMVAPQNLRNGRPGRLPTPCELSLGPDGISASPHPPETALPKAGSDAPTETTNPYATSPHGHINGTSGMHAQLYQSYQQNLVSWVQRQHLLQVQQRQQIKKARQQRKQALEQERQEQQESDRQQREERGQAQTPARIRMYTELMTGTEKQRDMMTEMQRSLKKANGKTTVIEI